MTRVRMNRIVILLALSLPAVPEDSAPAAAPFRVRLLAPLTTKFSRKGDLVSAQVVEPSMYAGGILEGDVREIRPGGSGKSSSVQFEFHTLHIAGKLLPVTASLTEISNSRHQSGTDDEGNALDAAKHGVAGKVTSVFSHGGSGVNLAAKSASLSFGPGSEFVLQVQFRKSR